MLVNTSNRSKEEFNELRGYLQEQLWDLEYIPKTPVGLPTLKRALRVLLDEIEDVVKLSTPQTEHTGDIINQLKKLEHLINGIE